MANDAEIRWIAAAQDIGRALHAGADPSRDHEITHRFYAQAEDVELRKALEARGVCVSEREDSPGFEARRNDRLSPSALKPVVEELCRLADKYSAEYDGCEISVNDNCNSGRQ